MSNSAPLIRIADFGDPDQVQSIGLRYEVLRRPLGLMFDPEELFAESAEVHIVAKQGDLVVGCMLLKPAGAMVLKMRQVAVTEKGQGSGTGTAMVAFAGDWAKNNGYTAVELHARMTAVPFYKRLQYEVLGEEFEEVGIPHLKLRKQL